MGLTVKNLICHVRVTLPAETVETAGRPLDLSTLSKVEALIGDRFGQRRQNELHAHGCHVSKFFVSQSYNRRELLLVYA